MLTAVHRCMSPAAKASAGKTSIVQPLAAEEAELRAEVKDPHLAAPQHVVGHVVHLAGANDRYTDQDGEVGDEDEEYPVFGGHEGGLTVGALREAGEDLVDAAAAGLEVCETLALAVDDLFGRPL